jgi:uncharacterized SAM-binding protein YcdF (DUF218 family)
MSDVFFVLSKLVWGIISPLSLALILFIVAVGLLWLNRLVLARGILTFLAALGVLIWVYPVGDWMIAPLEMRFPVPELPEEIDTIIVLGGAEQLKISASRQQAAVGEGAERILFAASLSQSYPDAKIIYSGGSNLVQMPDLPSHETIQTLFQQAGVEKGRLLIEGDARNTDENFRLIAPLLNNKSGHHVLITSAFHMPRAIGIAQKQGIEVLAYPVDYRSHPATYRYADFDLSGHLDVLNTAWHEWLGLTVYYLTGRTDTWLPSPKNE